MKQLIKQGKHSQMKIARRLLLLSSLLVLSSCQDVYAPPVRELCIINSHDLACQDPRKGKTEAEQQYDVELSEAVGYLCVTQETYTDYFEYGQDVVTELKQCNNEVSRLKAMCRQ